MGIYGTVTGRLGRDPESRQAGSSSVCNFSVATDHGYGDKKVTTWVRVAVWGKLGETCQQYLTKGRQVVVSGEIWNEDYNDKTSMQMEAKAVDFVGGKNDGESTGNGGAGSRGGYGGGTNNGGSSGGYGGRKSDGGAYDDDPPF